MIAGVDLGAPVRIEIQFQFKNELEPLAVTGVEGDVTDLLLPVQGDLVTHADMAGKAFTGKVVLRHFVYRLPHGEQVDGYVTVLVLLTRVSVPTLPVH